MATKYVAGTTNAILIGDKGANGAPPTSTKVGSNLCSAALELQSTTRGFLPPRMTTAQINAIAYPVNGMRAYNTTLQTDVVYVNGQWVTQNIGLTGDLYAEGTLTAQQVRDLYENSFPIIAAPGASKAIIVKNFFLALVYVGPVFTDGGAIGLQYTQAARAEGYPITPTIAAGVIKGASNGGALISSTFAATGEAPYLNDVVCINNATGAFAGGGTSTVQWKVWYSIVSF